MNKLTIIGNLTADPESRTTQSGKQVCHFTVAVNKNVGNQEADFIRVSVWGKLGEICMKYLEKGRKVCVVGPVAASAYIRDNTAVATMQITAEDIEFLSQKASSQRPNSSKEAMVLADETYLSF